MRVPGFGGRVPDPTAEPRPASPETRHPTPGPPMTKIEETPLPGVAERLQVSAAVGAFLVGVALTGSVAEQLRVLLGPLRDLFAAIFFVFFGLQIDPTSIPPVAGLAAVLGLVSSATKVATGWWAAARAGVGVPGRMRAGTALIARGEFSILLAGLGVTAGAEPRLGPLAAAYVLLTAVAGPILARWSDPLVTAVQARRARRADGRAVATSEAIG